MRISRESSPPCSSAARVTASLLLAFLSLSTPITAVGNQQAPLPILPPLLPQPVDQTLRGEHVFSLRHIYHHGTHEHPNLHKKLDVLDPAGSLMLESEDPSAPVLSEVTRPLIASSSPLKIERLKDRRPSVVDPMVASARESGELWALSPSAWTTDELPGPNITDKATILTLAQMAANAYVEKPDTGDWKDVNGGFNRTDDYGFGWDEDGLRGYIYVDQTNSTIVIGLKGTSLAVYDGEGTTTNDKENDNLFFSCCCGQQGSSFYRQVCDCATGTYTCNTSCLKSKLKSENRYYSAARNLYSNVTALYPNANIWMSGHSLGGSVSAMLGLTYGIPVVTFQAVPDALPSSRLGLPVPPGQNPDTPQRRELTGAYHFGHTADPIYLGTCNGATASCSYAGYALESSCHTGRECVYDVVGDKGWGVHIWSHRIITVIEQIIKVYDTVPECKFTPECQDCPLWKDVEGNSSSTTSTASTSTATRTRTATCQTPGWWGCLDESTTADATTTRPITTTSTSTSTCRTPGWFGCNDVTTTASTTTSSSMQPTTTMQTCTSPGFFGGCNDPSPPPTSTIGLIPTSTGDCSIPGRFWGCYDATSTSPVLAHVITAAPSLPTVVEARDDEL